MDTFTTFLKYMLIVATSLVTFIALLLVSYGVTCTGSAGYPKFAYFTAALGFYIMCAGFVGTFAAIRESKILSWVLIGMSAVSFFLLTVFMITFAVMKDDLYDATRTRLDSAFEMQEAGDDVQINKVQIYYRCCGKDSPQDYLKDDDDELPKSCCSGPICSIPENIFTNGCYSQVLNIFESRSENLIYSCLGTLLLIAIGIVNAYFFLKRVTDEKEEENEVESK